MTASNAVPAAAAASETSATPDPSKRRQEGLAALKAGDVDKADEIARALFAKSANSPENIFLMAFVLAEQNRFAEAIKRLEDLVDDVPTVRNTVWGQTAEWMILQGRWIDAEQRCFEILNQLPDAIPVHRLLVQLYTRQGRRLDAARHLRHLCRLGNIEEQELHGLLMTFYSFLYNPDEEEYEPIGDLGKAHYEICADDWEAAENTLDALSDKNAAESALLGRILARQQQFERLGQWAAGVPESAKVTSDYWFAMGAHHANQGDHVAAIKSFCAAVVRDQTDSQSYLLLSRSLKAIDADAQATEAAKRAELIEQTQTIAREIAETPPLRLQKIPELIDLLGQLQRPFEALAWRAVLLVYESSNITESQAQQVLTKINQARLQLLQSNEPVRSRSFELCGVSPELFETASDATSSAESE